MLPKSMKQQLSLPCAPNVSSDGRTVYAVCNRKKSKNTPSMAPVIVEWHNNAHTFHHEFVPQKLMCPTSKFDITTMKISSKLQHVAYGNSLGYLFVASWVFSPKSSTLLWWQGWGVAETWTRKNMVIWIFIVHTSRNISSCNLWLLWQCSCTNFYIQNPDTSLLLRFPSIDVSFSGVGPTWTRSISYQACVTCTHLHR